MDKRRIIYYENELTDEFSTAVITPKAIDEAYVYCHDSAFKKFTHFFWYRVIATPIGFLYAKLSHGHRIVGKERLRAYKKRGYFLYGNHTQPTGDAVIPSLLTFPKDAYVIVHPNNVSMPYLGRVTPSMGALPLPDNMAAYRNFIHAVERRATEGNAVVIYPEAHIWPYYTGIRPFKDDAFAYPVKLGTPVFCFVNTYQKRRLSKKPRIVTYIDGPFAPNTNLPPRQQRRELRDRVYAQMCEHAKLNRVEVIQYVKKEEEHG
ncbi:MAG: hypothetical protein E7661_03130 [Ruminococcaceae bacterium]|nr:hypothetical protein [Oscillospiraceae bacterium]